MIISNLPVWWIGLMFLSYFSYTLRWFPLEGAHPTTEWAINPPIVFTFNPSSENLQMIYYINISEGARLVGGYLQHAFLPICTQIMFMLGTWVLLTRASMLGTIGEDYLVTARAKGVSEWKILTKHALRNACLPIITSVALSFGFVIAGSVVVETVFRYPGIGLWLYDAVTAGDYPVLMTVFYVISLSVIIANAAADLLYGLLDPRIKTG